MDSSSCLLRVTPSDGPVRHTTTNAIRHQHNRDWYCQALSFGDDPPGPARGSREATPAEALIEPQRSDEFRYQDRLEFTFAGLFGDEQALHGGVRFGTSEKTCHVVLGGDNLLSRIHFALVVGPDLRIWLRDCGSKHGTAVECDRQNAEEVRKGDIWILTNRPANPPLFKNTSVYAGGLRFDIEFPGHARGAPAYINALQMLARLCHEPSPSTLDGPSGLQFLGLSSIITTADASSAVTPGKGPVYWIGDRLGSGAQGEVHKCLQLRTGNWYAAKTYRGWAAESVRTERERELIKKLRREFEVVRDKRHPNVLQVVEFREEPVPRLVTAYYPDGSLENANTRLTHWERMSAFGQILAGLDHLHGQAVVHRDLKPANIFLQRRPHFTVVIGDFGFAKHLTDFELAHSVCGTPVYAAPEISEERASYAYATDIFSLGVIGIEWFCPLLFPDWRKAPRKLGRPIRAWNGQRSSQFSLLAQVKSFPLKGLLQWMLQEKPLARPFAINCLHRLLQEGLIMPRSEDGVYVSTEPPPLPVNVASQPTQRYTPLRPSPNTDVPPLQGGPNVATSPQALPAPPMPIPAPAQPNNRAGKRPQVDDRPPSGPQVATALVAGPSAPRPPTGSGFAAYYPQDPNWRSSSQILHWDPPISNRNNQPAPGSPRYYNATPQVESQSPGVRDANVSNATSRPLQSPRPQPAPLANVPRSMNRQEPSASPRARPSTAIPGRDPYLLRSGTARGQQPTTAQQYPAYTSRTNAAKRAANSDQ